MNTCMALAYCTRADVEEAGTRWATHGALYAHDGLARFAREWPTSLPMRDLVAAAVRRRMNAARDLCRQDQRYLHDPAGGVWGDCWRTAIACVLGVPRDDVSCPDVLDADEWRAAVSSYLATHGLSIARLTFPGTMAQEDVKEGMRVVYPGGSYLLGGVSDRGVNHCTAVLASGEQWDPHPSRQGSAGPDTDGRRQIGIIAVKSQ